MALRDVLDQEPRQRGITLWKFQWQPGSSKAPPLVFVGAILLFIGSIFLGIVGQYAYKEHRLASEGKLAAGTVVKKVVHEASNNGTSTRPVPDS